MSENNQSLQPDKSSEVLKEQPIEQPKTEQPKTEQQTSEESKSAKPDKDKVKVKIKIASELKRSKITPFIGKQWEFYAGKEYSVPPHVAEALALNNYLQ